MFIVFCIGIWMSVLGILAMLAKSEYSSDAMTRGRLLLWGILLVGSLFVFFRPHENIRSGEDPGVYVNTAARFAQEKGIFFKDKLLAQLEPASRYYFLFGHRFYGVTRDSCFRFTDIDACIVGPRFSSLYPVLMSFPCMIFRSPSAMLYVAPLFAILTGLVLGLLAHRLINHPWITPLVFLLYSLTPLIVWHGRSARAEAPASFFILSGVLFLVKAWQEERDRSWLYVVLGAFCIGAAPLFHVTAWFVAICVGVVAVLAAVSGRRAFLVYPPVAAGGVAAFIWIIANITDHYRVLRFLEPFKQYSGIIFVGLIVLYVCLICLSVFSDRVFGNLKKSATAFFEKKGIIVRAALFLLMTGVFIWMYLGSEPFDKRQFTGYEYHYAYPTDLRVVREFMSRIVCVLSIIGMGSFLMRPGRATLERSVVFVGLLPAALLMGNMYDIFMTRYLFPVFLPLIVLCLSSLVTHIPVRRVGDKIAFICFTALVLLFLVHHRSQLITVTQGKGTVEFIKSLADEMDADNSILLSEYARLATPFEHLFGIPLLSFDNETRKDYRLALEAWEKLMRDNPDKKAYFLTPFRAPVSSRFIFKQIRRENVEYDKLSRGRYQLPRETKKGSDTLTLYSMELAENKPASLPFVRDFDSSNMGIWNFSKFRAKNWNMKGLHFGPDRSVLLSVPEKKIELGSRLMLFYAVPNMEKSAAPEVRINDSKEPLELVAWKNMVGEWWVQVLSCPASGTLNEIKFLSSSEMYLTDVQLEGTGESWSYSVGMKEKSSEEFRSSKFIGRWTLADCGFAAPVPEWEDGFLFLLFTASGEEGSVSKIKLSRGNVLLSEKTVPVGGWTWQAWSLKHLRDKPGFSAFDMKVDPAYDSGLKNYPNNLGVRVGYIVVLDQIHL